jgi:hypothetical protein
MQFPGELSIAELNMRQPSLALRRFEKYDLVSIALGLHAMAILLAEGASEPVLIAVLVLAMLIGRLALGYLANKFSRRHPLLLIRGIVTLLLTGAVMVADGGTESRFFLWLVLVLAWQAVISPLADFRILAAVAAVVYVVVALASPGNINGTAIARFGLLAAFMIVLSTGRVLLEGYESRIRRLEHTVAAVLSISEMGIVVYDSDRQTPLFTNDAAISMGLASHDGMARLIPDGSTVQHKIDTLASLVEGAGWLPYEPRLFRVIGDPNRILRIGLHALRLEDAEPVVLVYGEVVEQRTTCPR